MTNLVDHAAQEEALRKYRLIAPLLEEGLSAYEKQNIRWVLRCQSQVSERTLRRYLAQYRQGGFDALLPKSRKDKGISKTITPEALAMAVKFKEELPSRSAERIQQLLRLEHIEVARSTLDRHLRLQGATKKVLQQKQGISGRRFVRSGRNVLWQMDVKYGPWLPDPLHPGKKQRTYLLAIIDDATRFVVHAEFYADQRQPILEDGLRKALLRSGVPDAIYVDNGRIFVSHWAKLACARLRIRHIHTQPYSPESKGKVERFNKTVEEDFMQEIILAKPESLQELNRLFRAWLSEGYNHKIHSSLEGKTPAQAFTEDSRPLRFASVEALRDAFLWEKQAKVDKTGCAKLSGRVYEAGMEFCRKAVLLRFDPFDSEKVEVWSEGKRCRVISPIQVGEYNHQQKVPLESLEKASHSRSLDMMAKAEQQRLRQQGLHLSKERGEA
jgi:putative transposase